jgi:hypothetical protein
MTVMTVNYGVTVLPLRITVPKRSRCRKTTGLAACLCYLLVVEQVVIQVWQHFDGTVMSVPCPRRCKTDPGRGMGLSLACSFSPFSDVLVTKVLATLVKY